MAKSRCLSSYAYFNESEVNLLPSVYNLVATAGNGSIGAAASGAGGSVKNVNVYVPNPNNTYSFQAGHGGDGFKPGAGGSVENLSVLDQAKISIYNFEGKLVKPTAKINYAGGQTLGSVTVVTGNGGDSSSSNNGGKGGDAENIAWAPWDPTPQELNFSGTSPHPRRPS